MNKVRSKWSGSSKLSVPMSYGYLPDPMHTKAIVLSGQYSDRTNHYRPAAHRVNAQSKRVNLPFTWRRYQPGHNDA